MPWFAAAFAVVGALGEGQKAKHQYKLDKIVSDSNTEVQNMLRESRNVVQGAQTSLNRYLQSRQNQTHLRNAGNNIEAIVANMSRLQEEAASGSLMRRIEASEALGSVAAQAGARGGAGSMSNHMLNSTIKLRAAISEAAAGKASDRAVSDMEQHLNVERENMILGLSDVSYVAGLDFMETQSPVLNRPSNASIYGNALMAAGQAYVGAGGNMPSIGGIRQAATNFRMNLTQRGTPDG